MKKVITILMIVLTIVMVTSCTANSGNSLSDWVFDDYSSSESEQPDNDDDGEESDESSSVVKPITGAGDFNAENNYNK